MTRAKKQKPEFLKIRVIRVDLYGNDVILMRGPAGLIQGAIRDAMKPPPMQRLMLALVKEHTITDGTQGVTFHDTAGTQLIWVPKDATVGTLIHEIFHATTMMLKSKGIRHSDETEEAYAYLCEYIFRQLTSARDVVYKSYS